MKKPYADWGGLNDIIKKMADWFLIEIIHVFDLKIIDDKDQKK